VIDELTNVTSTAVSVALDALAQRQQLIAANIANVNSANYTLRELNFEDALRRAIADTSSTPEESLIAMRQLKQDINTGLFAQQTAAGPIDVDAEMLRLNETVIRYQALIEGLGKYGSLARMAISEEVKR
jgi:flagellar basal-body rod protein FlgB